jgi:hypothetical protein
VYFVIINLIFILYSLNGCPGVLLQFVFIIYPHVMKNLRDVIFTYLICIPIDFTFIYRCSHFYPLVLSNTYFHFVAVVVTMCLVSLLFIIYFPRGYSCQSVGCSELHSSQQQAHSYHVFTSRSQYPQKWSRKYIY